MEINPYVGVAIMLNNYFHDIAAAFLAASGVVIYISSRFAEPVTPEGTRFFLLLYRKMSKIFHYALAWVIIGGVPRTLFFNRFEWANAAGKGQIPALLVKHVLIVALVAGGFIGWMRLKRKVARLEIALGQGNASIQS